MKERKKEKRKKERKKGNNKISDYCPIVGKMSKSRCEVVCSLSSLIINIIINFERLHKSTGQNLKNCFFLVSSLPWLNQGDLNREFMSTNKCMVPNEFRTKMEGCVPEIIFLTTCDKFDLKSPLT